MGALSRGNRTFIQGFCFHKLCVVSLNMSVVTGTADKFCLKWNDFESNVSTSFRDLREDGDFFDVTLACDGNQLEAHKVILSACSPFFRGVLKRNPHSHPLLYLKGVKYEDVLAVLNFMYHGEVNIAQTELNSFLAVAEDLQVKGLTQSATSQPTHPHNNRRHTDTHRNTKHKTSVSPRVNYEQQQQPSVGMDNVSDLECQSVKKEPGQHLVLDLADQSVEHREQGEEEEKVAQPVQSVQSVYPSQDFHYQEEMAQLLGEGAAGNDRNILLKYITRSMNKDGSGEDQFKCDVCGKIGGRKDNMLNHVETIHFPGTFDYKCHVCTKPMPTKKALNNHIYRNHKDDPTDIIVETQYVE